MSTHNSSRSSSTSSEDPKKLDTEDVWQDAEPDEENVIFQCLFGSDTFDNTRSFLEHCKFRHNFDLVFIRRELGLWISSKSRHQCFES